jgi:hypothetical protein
MQLREHNRDAAKCVDLEFCHFDGTAGLRSFTVDVVQATELIAKTCLTPGSV